MQFWYMQLHPGNGWDWTLAKKAWPVKQTLGMLRKYRLIGLGNETQWPNDRSHCRDRFRESMKIGDIVMCAHGMEYIALVEVVGEAFDNVVEYPIDASDGCWFGVARKVRILDCNSRKPQELFDSRYGQDASRKGVAVRSTLCHWHKNGFIQFWYNHLKE